MAAVCSTAWLSRLSARGEKAEARSAPQAPFDLGVATSHRGFRRWLRALAFAALAVLPSACSSAAPPHAAPSVAASSARAPVTLTFWHAESGPARTQLDAFASELHRVYPWITLRGVAKAGDGDLLREGLAAIALDQPPDLMLASPRTIAELARRNALVALDPFVTDPALGLTEEERSDFLPGALQAGRLPEFKDQLASFPFDARAVVLYYNADYLQGTKFSAAPRTWDDFAACARSTTRSDVRGWVMSPDAAVFYGFIYSRGGNVLDETQTRVEFDGDAGDKTLQLIATLARGGAAYLAASADQARADFAHGKAALWLGTTGDLGALASAVDQAGGQFRWGIANIPQDNLGEPATALLTDNIAIFRTTNERARAAWLVARWLVTPEQAARWSRITFTLPLRLSARSLLADSPPKVLPPVTDNFASPPTGRAVPVIKDAAALDQAVVELWTSVANGADLGAAMQRAVQRANRVLGTAP